MRWVSCESPRGTKSTRTLIAYRSLRISFCLGSPALGRLDLSSLVQQSLSDALPVRLRVLSRFVLFGLACALSSLALCLGAIAFANARLVFYARHVSSAVSSSCVGCTAATSPTSSAVSSECRAILLDQHVKIHVFVVHCYLLVGV